MARVAKATLLTLLIIIILSAPTIYAEEELRILTSFYPAYIMALNITSGVAGVNVNNLSPKAIGCLHDYSPTTDDMRLISTAGVFVVNGLGMERFLPVVIEQYPSVKVIDLSSGLDTVESHGLRNSHLWVSIQGAIGQVRNLKNGLSKIDPVNAIKYHENSERYIAKLNNLRARMEKGLQPYRGRRIVTFHEAFPYFAKEFGFEIAASIEREPGTEPSARELADTIALIRKSGIKEIFVEPQYPSKIAQTIARDANVKIYTLDPVVSGPYEPDAYLDIMERNFETLLNAFSNE